MDDHTDDLIAQLCTRIGAIMEDASVSALTVGGKSPGDRQAAIDELDGAAKRIDALVTAVRALQAQVRSWGRSGTAAFNIWNA